MNRYVKFRRSSDPSLQDVHMRIHDVNQKSLFITVGHR